MYVCMYVVAVYCIGKDHSAVKVSMLPVLFEHAVVLYKVHVKCK